MARKGFHVRVEDQKLKRDLRKLIAIFPAVGLTKVEVGAYMAYSHKLEKGSSKQAPQGYIAPALVQKFDANTMIDTAPRIALPRAEKLGLLEEPSGGEQFMAFLASGLNEILIRKPLTVNFEALFVRACSGIVRRAKILSPYLYGANRRTIHARSKSATDEEINAIRREQAEKGDL